MQSIWRRDSILPWLPHTPAVLQVIGINTSGRLKNPNDFEGCPRLLSFCKPSYHNSKFLQTGAVHLSTFYSQPKASMQPTWYLTYQPQSLIPQFCLRYNLMRDTSATGNATGFQQDAVSLKSQCDLDAKLITEEAKMMLLISWASYVGSEQICWVYSSSSAQPCQVPLVLARISLQKSHMPADTGDSHAIRRTWAGMPQRARHWGMFQHTEVCLTQAFTTGILFPSHNCIDCYHCYIWFNSPSGKFLPPSAPVNNQAQL